MCGIICAVAHHSDVAEILLQGLCRLEYRGYDSAGIAVVDIQGNAIILRRLGKVKNLIKAANNTPLIGSTGIAHTRWATHGEPSEKNAHPHISQHIMMVHNGIIENHDSLREKMINRGYTFSSKTDTEVVVHLIHWEQQQNGGKLFEVIQRIIPQLCGSYSIAVVDSRYPSNLVVACYGNPLVIGCGVDKNFVASDELALLSVTRRFISLKEGDIAEVTHNNISIFNRSGAQVLRKEYNSRTHYDSIDKGFYRFYMEKEIYEQPLAIKNTLNHRLYHGNINLLELGKDTCSLFAKVEHIKIIACGTSYNAGMVARYWFESLAKVSCDVEMASEFRYRKSVIHKNSLVITLSQSGETADTLACLRLLKKKTIDHLGSLTICNMLGSSLVRESDLFFMTKAGIEIGVAATKTFTSQLTVLLMLVSKIGRMRGIDQKVERNIVQSLQILPKRIEQALSTDKLIAALAKDFYDKHSVLFIGRGYLYPIVIEGALKLKEVSYIHAEAYAAGELKHGPLALIDNNIPVIVVAPKNKLLNKLKSNIEEVRSRGAPLYIFTDVDHTFEKNQKVRIISMPHVEEIIAPIFYIVPLQLFSYHVALIKGNDVDQPRNLAKSVTVE